MSDYADNYPEHMKLDKIKNLSQACGEFIEWLQCEKGVFLAVYDKKSTFGDLYRANIPTHVLLAEFFEIDEKKLEAEKRAMLDSIRAANAERETAT